MAKTSKTLNDKEISIIKKLVEQGKPSQEIMGIINIKRGDPSLHVNFGRISDIKNGKTKRALGIEPATDEELAEFLKENSNNEENKYSHSEDFSKLFPIKTCNPLVLDISETDTLECKENFAKDEKNLLRPLCALANNKGGYILYGVKDKTWEVVGINDKGKQKFLDWDLQSLDGIVLNYLSCGIEVSKSVIPLEGINIAILKVNPARKKPVIFISNVTAGGENFSTGDIFFRYPGSSRKICPSELDKIIEERMQVSLKTTLMKQMETIFRNGIENSAVLNVATGEVEGKSGSFVIDEKLLPQIQFIKEGEFVETKGAPTLKLLGDVKPLNAIAEVETEVSIDIKSIVNAFLKDSISGKPLEYLKVLALSSRKWAPFFYFVRSKKISNKSMIKYLNDLQESESRTYPQYQLEMIEKKNLPLINIKDKEKYIEDISTQKDIKLTSPQNAILFCASITQMKKENLDLNYCRKKLKYVFDTYWSDSKVRDKLLYACSYLDMLFYKELEISSL